MYTVLGLMYRGVYGQCIVYRYSHRLCGAELWFVHIFDHLFLLCERFYLWSWKSEVKWKMNLWQMFLLTHWGWVTHICISELTITGSNNVLSPGRHQAIIWTNAGIWLIPTSISFSEILSEIHIFSLKKMYLKMLSAKWRQICLGLSVLTIQWSLSV